MVFKSSLPPWQNRPKSQSRRPRTLNAFERIILFNFSVSSWLLMGALLQSVVVAFVPRLYAFAPTALILLARLANNLAITFGWKKNPYLEDVIPDRVSAQLPDLDGNFSDKGSSEKVVIFLLGAKFNHPLGLFAPNVKALGDHLNGMVRILDSEAASNGFLGASSWTGHDQRGATELTLISYWRSIDDVHRFAYGPSHRAAWDWWNKLTPSESRHLGINHEIFSAEPGQWEALYVNFQPTLLGATTYLRKGDKLIGGTVEDQWISPLVDAKRGKLKSSAGRLGWQPDTLYQKFDHEPKEADY